MDDGVYNASIKGADLFLSGGERDRLGFSLLVDYGGMCQEFTLMPTAKLSPKTANGTHISSEATHLTSYVLIQTLRVADVASWKDLAGRPIVVVVANGCIREIRHFLKPEINLDVRRYIARNGANS